MLGTIKNIGKRYLPPKVKTWLKRIIIRYNIDFGTQTKQTKNAIKVQNTYDLGALRSAKKIVVFLVPSNGQISGGLLSIFQFASFTRKIEPDAQCVIATVPGRFTYAHAETFKNTEQIYRWAQVVDSCQSCDELIIHIPEFFADHFYDSLSRKNISVLQKVAKLRINILNQNIDYMPERERLSKLYLLTDDVSQSAGFTRYANQDVCNTYGMPLYFVPSYVNLDDCVTKELCEKKKLILFSNDHQPDKGRILSKLQDEFIDYELREINNLTYDEYLNLIAEAKFTISFGEGFDGYYIQPYYAKSIGVTVYNDKFFPDKAISDFPFVYSSYDEMHEKICNDIRMVTESKEKYEAISSSTLSYLVSSINRAENTISGLQDYYNCAATFYPTETRKSERSRAARKPIFGIFQRPIKILKSFYFELTFEKQYPGTFYQRMYSLITGCSFYYFDDTNASYRPDEAPDYALERSCIKRLERRVTIWQDMDAAFGLKNLEACYELFDDDKSRHLFLLRMLNNIYDSNLVRFPLFYSKLYQHLEKITALADRSEVVSLWHGILNFMKFPLQKLGIDLTLWGGADSIFIEFFLDQYRYKNLVSIEDGDNVIDGGACYGETALHFATQTSGQIYSFEFMPENVELFHKNMELNPKYKGRVTLVERPLGAESNEKVYAVFNGPGTSISNVPLADAIELTAITVDDFVKENNIDKIDFIKLDVEGSEEAVLRGASETIKRFRPKLAICGYHKKDDLLVLPKLIKEYLPEYSLYLEHHTTHNNETVIYAVAKKKAKLTAILFTYNHRDSIARCIESLLFQETEYLYEIHIWDDCSIDGTSEVCRQYAEKYGDKIRLFLQKSNTFLNSDLGLQSFSAISNIKTDYFCVIDGDDYWCDKTKIQTALSFLEAQPEYIGYAHDTLQVDKNTGTSLSYINSLLKLKVSNPVTFGVEAPFFLTSSRIFRSSGYHLKNILPIDYLLYYYHLAKGPIYYHDKIMAAYVIGENNTFANLGGIICDLNSMFPYRLAKMFDFQQDEFCTALLKKHDEANSIGDTRHRRLCFSKRIFGTRLGWHVWFYLTFVWRYGFECAEINFVYSRSKAKKLSDSRARK